MCGLEDIEGTPRNFEALPHLAALAFIDRDPKSFDRHEFYRSAQTAMDAVSPVSNAAKTGSGKTLLILRVVDNVSKLA